MEHKEFSDALSDLLGSDARRLLLEAGEREGDAPLDNFFGDDWLTLLYFYTESCRPMLECHRENLKTVADKKASRQDRIDAALALGELVALRGSTADSCGRGVSRPTDWFRFARQLGSVQGALSYANALLDADKQSVQFDKDKDLLPQLVWTSKDDSSDEPAPSSKVCDAWLVGVRVALRHVQRDFDGWGDRTFGCALACVVNYLTLLPQIRLGRALQVAQRQAALVWIKPLWNRLIAAASERGFDTKRYRAFLIEQKLAVLLLLEDREQTEDADTKIFTPVDLSSPEDDRVVVIRGKIPDTSDRSEMGYLRRYEALRRPVALTALPDLAELGEIRRQLEVEFPWASGAIALVMSDLFARRRHGVVRLGLLPILLVGLPGTGKTRFAQRLSDLLGTPNTVINLAGMSDVKLLKGVTRGWSSNRPSRMVEFIQQRGVANPLFVLDEIDKAGVSAGSYGGNPQEALLDLLEPGNARRYQDIYLMTECDLSHCLYVATSNSLSKVPEPLLSRLRPVYFPSPGPEHTEGILKGMLADLERGWGLPEGALTITPRQIELLRGLAPREMRSALLDLLGSDVNGAAYTLH
ncbi:MAG: AAA family ATPase [Castellaniella sp.]|uniref:AAA family ATPase n=1 Tax=Castellaniella sp. TaxID=1955812 RepID=UPI003C75FE83